jgi:hypothetical protein
MRTCAFVTYNQLGEGEVSSGWHEQGANRALVLQNTEGKGSLKSNNPIGEAARVSQLNLLWSDLQKSLPNLDEVVVYLGAKGSQRAIELLRESEVPAEKVTFVACDCGLGAKEAMIQVAGFDMANRILCNCGGHRVMKKLFVGFMDEGKLPSCYV